MKTFQDFITRTAQGKAVEKTEELFRPFDQIISDLSDSERKKLYELRGIVCAKLEERYSTEVAADYENKLHFLNSFRKG